MLWLDGNEWPAMEHYSNTHFVFSISQQVGLSTWLDHLCFDFSAKSDGNWGDNTRLQFTCIYTSAVVIYLYQTYEASKLTAWNGLRMSRSPQSKYIYDSTCSLVRSRSDLLAIQQILPNLHFFSFDLCSFIRFWWWWWCYWISWSSLQAMEK